MAKFHSSLWLSSISLWASLVAQLVKNPPAMQEALDGFLGQKIPWRTDRTLQYCWASLVAQIHLQCKRPGFNPWFGKIHCRRAWQPTPVFLSGESHVERCLTGYSSWGHKESDTTEQLSTAQHSIIYINHVFFIFSFGASISWQL